MLVDAHCHLDSIKEYKLSDEVLPVTVGYSHSSNIKTLEIAKRLRIPFVLGISPQAAQKEGLVKLDEWTEWIKNTRPNAIGEIGLDYHWAKNEEDRKRQHTTFKKMLDLAEEMKLPIVIHARETISEILDILKERKFQHGIMMHFFSGNEREAKRAVELGSYISIVPLHSKERRKVINAIELEYLLVETDAPAIVRLPEDVKKSVEYISEVKELDFGTVATQTAKNAKKFFRI
ncbi:TatD family hydrolase [Candidatus Micrarchaeota archaeon]|nr:TatD family hydrolase [Candidatus Micrarchaeota archaeon]